jgi:hypothetical protein
LFLDKKSRFLSSKEQGKSALVGLQMFILMQ